MRELPILFSTDMVKAILDGRKTMTRRVCKLDTANFDYDLKDKDYGPFLQNEYGEVVEALLLGNPVEVIRESLDCMQTHWTLIQMVAGEYRINIDRLYQEHCEKLRRKGYLKEG